MPPPKMFNGGSILEGARREFEGEGYDRAIDLNRLRRRIPCSGVSSLKIGAERMGWNPNPSDMSSRCCRSEPPASIRLLDTPNSNRSGSSVRGQAEAEIAGRGSEGSERLRASASEIAGRRSIHPGLVQVIDPVRRDAKALTATSLRTSVSPLPSTELRKSLEFPSFLV
jgi:hypothetical protein